jgi:uncharacterized membrane protein YdbT with pleckstrin-like domain
MSPSADEPPEVAPAAQPHDVPAEERLLFEGQPALVPGVGALLLCILTVGIALVGYWFRRRGTSYRVTSQRIVIDRGIFSKTLDQVDLYRINDFVVERPFSQRLLGTGNIRMQTFDKSTPVVELVALRTDVVQLYETIRAAVEKAKRTQGVRLVDYEQ